MTRSRPCLLACLLAALATPAVPGCGGRPGGAHSTVPAEPVTIETVALDSTSGGAMVLPARVKAREEASITSRVAGRLTTLLVREGDRVHAGQSLARFDAPESRRALTAARREWESAKLAQDVAQRQQARIDSLFGLQVASQRDRELAENERRAAEARYEAAQSDLESLEAALEARSPFDGVVVRRHVDPGADVQPGAPLLDVRSAEGVEIFVPVPEAAVAALSTARLSYQTGDGPWHPARLTRLEGSTDYTTRTRAAHLAPVGPPAPEPGAFARVRLESPDLPDAAVRELPASSIVRRGALTGAFVIENDHAVLRWLKLGREQAGAVEVISGLWPGERVARDAAGLADGVPVRIRS
jgi:RND family efflux transporter MFP subunit